MFWRNHIVERGMCVVNQELLLLFYLYFLHFYFYFRHINLKYF